MARSSIFKELFLFIKAEKKWWLVPLLVVMFVVVGLIVLASSSPAGVFVYPLF